MVVTILQVIPWSVDSYIKTPPIPGPCDAHSVYHFLPFTIIESSPIMRSISSLLVALALSPLSAMAAREVFAHYMVSLFKSISNIQINKAKKFRLAIPTAKPWTTGQKTSNSPKPPPLMALPLMPVPPTLTVKNSLL
jgi:hypothetical protein